MSTSDSSPDDPSTEDEFDHALGDLIETATNNGIDVRGGWRVDVDDDHDLGIEIYRVVAEAD